jgi:hypothetical protein
VGATGATGSVGATGPTGSQGATGPAGAAGANGANGLNGLNGAAGATGATGPQGLAGTAGATGPTGSVGGSDGQIIFNDQGAGTGSSALTWNYTSGFLGIGSSAPGSILEVNGNGKPSVVTEVVKGDSSQTADLTEWQNSSKTVLAAVNNAGVGLFTGGTQFKASGAGSTPLNWYELGTFTPTYSGGTTAGTCTYTTQAARFVRIGALVHFSINLAWQSCSPAPTGIPRIGNLPYASTSQNGLIQVVQVIPTSYTTGSAGILQGIIQPNTQYVELHLVSTQSTEAYSVATIDTNAGVNISGTYSTY